MARERCLLMVLFGIPMVVELLQWIGILGCVWPRSSWVHLKLSPLGNLGIGPQVWLWRQMPL